MNHPLLILASPRSFTSVICAALGQHPQMYGFPELHLFAPDTLAGRERFQGGSKFNIDHGLLRVLAELFFGGQTEDNVRRAARWLLRRAGFSPGYIIRQIATKVAPRILVEKSPSTGRAIEYLERAAQMFPCAQFIHLVRNPRGHGQSVLKFLREREKEECVPATHWMRHPKDFWFLVNRNICRFLDSIPPGQQMRLRGKDILTEPDAHLRKIAEWLGLRTDDAAIEDVKHPERSAYACFGPTGARFGNDRFFLDNPTLRPTRAEPQSLEGPLSWRSDGGGFSALVKRLAREFGYE
jgi:hypothetical protein